MSDADAVAIDHVRHELSVLQHEVGRRTPRRGFREAGPILGPITMVSDQQLLTPPPAAR